MIAFFGTWSVIIILQDVFIILLNLASRIKYMFILHRNVFLLIEVCFKMFYFWLKLIFILDVMSCKSLYHVLNLETFYAIVSKSCRAHLIIFQKKRMLQDLIVRDKNHHKRKWQFLILFLFFKVYHKNLMQCRRYSIKAFI
jgi:hypothetical protein